MSDTAKQATPKCALHAARQSPGQTLLFDADDTLWENYIYFEQSIARFIEFLDHATHSPQQVREVLNACEARNIRDLGYGLLSFEISLVHCFEQLMSLPPSMGQRQSIASFAHSIATQPIELLPDVAHTLELLATRHTLVLVTKGHPLEQMDKLRRSGLQHFFAHVEVLAEKEPAAYQRLGSAHGWQKERCWMIGNSPKSDISAALVAGLNTVHVPHEQTWVLEHCDIPEPVPPQRSIRLERFAQLASVF